MKSIEISLDFTSIQSSYDDLKGGLMTFWRVPLDSTSSSLTLKDGIAFLENASPVNPVRQRWLRQLWRSSSLSGQPLKAMGTIQSSFLYTLRKETPVTMVKERKLLSDKLQAYQDHLLLMIQSASYNALWCHVDSYVRLFSYAMALVTTLKAAKMRKGLNGLMAGAYVGVLCHVIAAILKLSFQL